MKTIYKYQFPIHDQVSIAMPIDAEILSVQVQRGQPCIWALVDPYARQTSREILLFGTGQPIDGHEIGRFVGTFQIDGGDFIFHLFEKATHSQPT